MKAMQETIVALREENDIQRASIQKLSAQVVAYQEALTTIRDNTDLWKIPKIGGQDKYAGMPPLVRKIDGILSSPDPGADIRERMVKLEAVAEAAQETCYVLYDPNYPCGPELERLLKALTALGDRP